MRKLLRKKEIRELNNKIEEFYGYSECCSAKAKVEVRDDLVYVDDTASFFYLDSQPIPTLKLLLKTNFLKKIVVDMGAVKFVISGADVMRPGITKFDDGIKQGDIVVVIDETHGKPLAVCQALYSSEELQHLTSGKVLKNLHYVGDKIWNS